MKQILVIETSPQRFDSFSNKLSQAIVQKIQKSFPEAKLKIRDLIANPPPFLTRLEFGSFSHDAIAELMESDTLVLSVATHNYTIPAVLKAWIDQVAVAGKTFSYSAEGPKGLVVGKKVYLAIASGGVHSEGKPHIPDFTEAYLKSILAFLGVTDVRTFRVEGLAIPGIKETALQTALQKLDQSFSAQ